MEQKNDEVDERGARYDSPFYPHTLNCFRKGMSLTNPMPCDCGGNEIAEKLRGDNHDNRN